MAKIIVKGWGKSLGIVYLEVTAEVVSDKVVVSGTNGSHQELGFDNPVKLGLPAGKRGDVTLSFTVGYDAGGDKPRGWSHSPKDTVPVKIGLPIECTPTGEVTLLRKGRTSVSFDDQDLSVDVEIYSWTDHPCDIGPSGVPKSAWNDWMKQLGVLHIVAIAKLAMTNGGGSVSFTFMQPFYPVPSPIVAGATGPTTAVVGPMQIDIEPVDVAPPLTAPQGIRYRVYFDVDSADLDKVVKEAPGGAKDQGKALDDWIKADLLSRWDVSWALLEKLPIHGEARASATLPGKTNAELLHYNQDLSRKRLDAVVKRLTSTVRSQPGSPSSVDTTQMQATGAVPPIPGKEDVNNRSCDLWIDGDELAVIIKRLLGRKFKGWSARSCPKVVGA